jgi:hypothetical protein
MLRSNKHLEKLILDCHYNVLEILKVVAPHNSLRHLEFAIGMPGICMSVKYQAEWNEVFSRICAKLTTFVCFETMPDCP